MKHILILSSLVILSLFLFFTFDSLNFSRDKYVSKKVLELSTPLNVTIDVEFLKSLDSAHE